MDLMLEKACLTIESEKLLCKPVEVDLQFELGHLLNRTITEMLRQVTLDFISGLFLGGLVPTPLAHGKVAILYEPGKSRLRIWPLSRLFRTQIFRNERFQFFLCHPLLHLADLPEREGNLSSLLFSAG